MRGFAALIQHVCRFVPVPATASQVFLISSQFCLISPAASFPRHVSFREELGEIDNKELAAAPESANAFAENVARVIALAGYQVGNLIRSGEAYSAYEQWCKVRGLEPVSLTKFGTIMKSELGVAQVRKSGRCYYEGIALKGGLKVVAG